MFTRWLRCYGFPFGQRAWRGSNVQGCVGERRGACGSCSTTNVVSQNIILASDRAALARCTSVGQIQSQSLWGGIAATGVAYNDAMASLKNQAAERGATHILLVSVSNTVGGTNMIGDAYRCP